MRWRKLGRVYAPDGSTAWMTSHAYVPTPHVVDDDTIRVYVAFLDRERIGRVGFVDVAAADPLRVVAVSERPVLDVGRQGAFDEHGVTPSAVVADGDAARLYYFGWQRSNEVPYLLFGGVAVSENGSAAFERSSSSPSLPPVPAERVCRSAPSVMRDEGGWRAWYVAADGWVDVDGRQVPTYDIRTSLSEDGVRWGNPGSRAVALADDDEFGLGRPFVCRTSDGYRMWYSIRTRSRGYRLGYATSNDGQRWTRRDDEVGIDVSSEGWDSEMVCFGAVVVVHEATYLFYNGNEYGRTGFGVAILEQD